MKKLKKIRIYCQSKWNGDGEDVFQETIAIAMERYGDIEKCNISILKKIAKEAARNLMVYRYRGDSNIDGYGIEMHENEQTRIRLVLHNAGQDNNDIPKLPLDEEEKKQWLAEIKRLRDIGYTDEEIVQMLRPVVEAEARKEKQEKKEPVQGALFILEE